MLAICGRQPSGGSVGGGGLCAATAQRETLRLLSLLLPLRRGCSGGAIPTRVREASRRRPPGDDGDGGDDDDDDGGADDDADAADASVMASKLEALVEELRAVRARDASSKALVFSSFKSTIDWLAAAAVHSAHLTVTRSY